MNWNLVFRLSLLGLVMAIATLWLPSNIEPFFWLLIFIYVAFKIAKQAPGKYFLHGLCVGLANSFWVTSAHVLFAKMYLANHAQEADMMTKMPWPTHPRIMMLIIGPVVGMISGFIIGLFAFVASKVFKTKAA